MNENNEREIREISVEEIIPNRFQPRLVFDEKELKELAASIKMHGIIQPLVLRKVSDKYEIIAGERRYKAACLAGLTKVPAIIMEMDDDKSAEIAVVENLQRKNLTAIEEAQSYQKILDKGYITQDELAGRMGVSQPTIANKIRLLKLNPEVQEALLANKISERHARSLLSIQDANVQVMMLRRIISERLTVRQTDEEISKLIGKPVSARPTENTLKESASNQNIEDNIFNVNINDIRKNAEDIIKPQEPANIEMLLKKPDQIEDAKEIDEVKPQPEIVEEKIEEPAPKINLEETEANVNMGDIVEEKIVPFTPFVEEEPEVLDFFNVKEESINKPIEENTNSIINEFREIQAQNNQENIENNEPSNNIASAINTSRETIKQIEALGFNVDTEEFDFEDMYQIIIKIKKDKSN